MHIPLLLSVVLGLGVSALPTAIDTPKLKPEASTRHLVERDDWSVTRNDLINGPCLPVTIIFARGTLELGNVGALAGPPFFNALGDMIGQQNLAVQGVDYGATIAGYLEGGDPAGAATMASLASLAVNQCPDTKIVLSGYRYISFLPNRRLFG
jgi:cutinase